MDEKRRDRMKFDDMKLNKESTPEKDPFYYMQRVDLAIGSAICEIFEKISIIGKQALLCTLIDALAQERGIDRNELIDEIRQSIEHVRGKHGRQAEDS